MDRRKRSRNVGPKRWCGDLESDIPSNRRSNSGWSAADGRRRKRRPCDVSCCAGIPIPELLSEDRMLKPGQISLDEAQIERGEARTADVEYDAAGNEVAIVRLPPGAGTFRDPREAAVAMRGVREAAASMPRSAPAFEAQPWEPPIPAAFTPHELIRLVRNKEGR